MVSSGMAVMWCECKTGHNSIFTPDKPKDEVVNGR